MWPEPSWGEPNPHPPPVGRALLGWMGPSWGGRSPPGPKACPPTAWSDYGGTDKAATALPWDTVDLQSKAFRLGWGEEVPPGGESSGGIRVSSLASPAHRRSTLPGCHGILTEKKLTWTPLSRNQISQGLKAPAGTRGQQRRLSPYRGLGAGNCSTDSTPSWGLRLMPSSRC